MKRLIVADKKAITSLIIGNFNKEAHRLEKGAQYLVIKGLPYIDREYIASLCIKLLQYRAGAVDMISLLDDQDLRKNLIWQIDQIMLEFRESLEKKLRQQEDIRKLSQFSIFYGASS